MRAPARALPLALLAAACSHSPPTTMLTLDALPPPSEPTVGYRGPPLVVPAVHVPATIDHTEYVSEPAAGTAKLDDFAQWVAPLGTLARDALVRDLTARLPAGAVLPPGAAGGAGTRTLDVTIFSFSAGADGAVLQAAYRTVPAGAVRQVEVRTPEASSGSVAGARAFAVLLGKLADRIVADQTGG